MRILVTGAAGRLGRVLVRSLHDAGHQVTGIDRRSWQDAPVQVHELDLLKRSAEELFRATNPEVVVHSAAVTGPGDDRHERHRVNLVGTKTVFDYCQRYHTAQTVFVSRHTYYGATSDSPLYHTEDEPPLGLETFPELADLVAADLFAASMLWRAPNQTIAVLRFVYTLGESHTGTLADFLNADRIPMVWGFDPLFQFMHEQDAASALALAIRCKLRGVYNVAGPSPLPLSALIRQAERRRIVLPEPVLRASLGKFGLPRLQPSAVDHIKYSLVIDDAQFRNATGFQARYGQLETIRSFTAPAAKSKAPVAAQGAESQEGN
jgi:UDP-glucose 4-epimerase